MNTGFEWGRSDCLLFVASWVEAATGKPAQEPWLGRYATEGEARTMLGEAGGAIEAFKAVLGEPAQGDDWQRGDVGLYAYDDWHLGLIFAGSTWVYRHGGRGIAFESRIKPTVWWRVRQSSR